MMTTDKEQNRHSLQEHSVWSDLRAMRSITQLQQEVQTLSTLTNRLKIGLVIIVLMLGVSVATLTVFGAITYNQLQKSGALNPSIPTQK